MKIPDVPVGGGTRQRRDPRAGTRVNARRRQADRALVVGAGGHRAASRWSAAGTSRPQLLDLIVAGVDPYARQSPRPAQLFDLVVARVVDRLGGDNVFGSSIPRRDVKAPTAAPASAATRTAPRTWSSGVLRHRFARCRPVRCPSQSLRLSPVLVLVRCEPGARRVVLPDRRENRWNDRSHDRTDCHPPLRGSHIDVNAWGRDIAARRLVAMLPSRGERGARHQR